VLPRLRVNVIVLGPCGVSVCQSPACHRGRPGSIPAQSVWDWWWTKWHCDRLCWQFCYSSGALQLTHSPTLHRLSRQQLVRNKAYWVVDCDRPERGTSYSEVGPGVPFSSQKSTTECDTCSQSAQNAGQYLKCHGTSLIRPFRCALRILRWGGGGWPWGGW
jgi:hypothetical protein